MAWHSGGESNTELVDNLVENGLISLSAVEKGFRNVDRKIFVPKGNEDIAYSDQPLKDGNIHISAPHIYCSALEALDLHQKSCLSFLNIGAGTGYLSSIVAEILGPRSLNIGVEIQKDVVQHARTCISEWRSAKKKSCGKRSAGSMTAKQDRDFINPNIIHGSGLEISSKVGESVTGFDRIYIGAAIESEHLPKIKALLSQGGILVGPVDDDLVKIVRIGKNKDDTICVRDNDVDELEFTTKVISSVRFAPLMQHPKMKTIIPCRLWNPTFHHLFPDSYQQSTMSLLLCSNSHYFQPIRPATKSNHVNLAASLPRDIWIHIISFTNRKWFEPESPQTEFLRKRICQEQEIASTAQKALLEAQARCYAAERERDLYRHMAQRWRSRLQTVLQQHAQHSSSSSTDVRSLTLPLLLSRDEEHLSGVASSHNGVEASWISLRGNTNEESSLEDESYTDNFAMENVEDVGNSESEVDDVRTEEEDDARALISIFPENQEGYGEVNISTDITSDSDFHSGEDATMNVHRQRRTVSISNDNL